jgi:CPA2 family monovalent cation:H+ antiporter-2
VADVDRAVVQELRSQDIPAVAGDAADPFVLIQAHIAQAAILVITTVDAMNIGKMVETARALNPSIAIFIRAQDGDSIAIYEKEGWGKSFTAEEELANRLSAEVVQKLQQAH